MKHESRERYAKSCNKRVDFFLLSYFLASYVSSKNISKVNSKDSSLAYSPNLHRKFNLKVSSQATIKSKKKKKEFRGSSLRREKRETRKIYKGKHLNPFPTLQFSFFFFFFFFFFFVAIPMRNNDKSRDFLSKNSTPARNRSYSRKLNSKNSSLHLSRLIPLLLTHALPLFPFLSFLFTFPPAHKPME